MSFYLPQNTYQHPRSARTSYTPDRLYRTEPRDNSNDSTQRYGTGSLLNSSYVAHGHASPYVEGKKNSGFRHPSLTSSNVFYDFDYAYKNDLPNERLLTPVKNDKYNSQGGNHGHSRSAIWNRSSVDDAQSETRSISPAFRTSVSTRPYATEADERVDTIKRGDSVGPYASVGGSMSERGGNNGPSHRKSASMANYERPSYEEEKPVKTGRDVSPLPVLKEVEEDVPAAGKCEKKGAKNDKYCADCLNQCHAERRRGQKHIEKQREKELEAEVLAIGVRKGDYTYDKERMRSMREAMAAQDIVNAKTLSEFNQRHYKELPSDKRGTIMDGIFNGQQERAKQMKEMQTSLRDHNMRKMMTVQRKKEEDRVDRLTSEYNSLQVGERYSNKYMMRTQNMMKHLTNQMNEKQERQMREQEEKRKFEKDLMEQNARALQREEQLKKEKVDNYKQMLRDQLDDNLRSKEQAKEMERINNERNKFYNAQSIQDFKNKEAQDNYNDKRNKAIYRQTLKEQQEQATYRRRHEMKKQYYESSLKIGIRPELHACAGCNKMKEPHHLAHKH